jgi:hypothetical protein
MEAIVDVVKSCGPLQVEGAPIQTLRAATVKPVLLVADASLDCTARGNLVLDQFAGSGTTILAADKVGRIAFGVEYEPGYVDVAIKRWQKSTKLEATLAGNDRGSEEIGAARSASGDAPRRRRSGAADVQSQAPSAMRGGEVSATGGDQEAEGAQTAVGLDRGNAR